MLDNLSRGKYVSSVLIDTYKVVVAELRILDHDGVGKICHGCCEPVRIAYCKIDVSYVEYWNIDPWLVKP